MVVVVLNSGADGGGCWGRIPLPAMARYGPAAQQRVGTLCWVTKCAVAGSIRGFQMASSCSNVLDDEVECRCSCGCDVLVAVVVLGFVLVVVEVPSGDGVVVFGDSSSSDGR